MNNHKHNYNQYSLANAKELRSDVTLFEKKLWFYLRAKRFYNLKFMRQVPIGKYIADFVCSEKMLIIELDGSGHLEEKQAKNDFERDKYLMNLGYKILRIYNTDVNNINSVLEYIKNNIM